MTTWLTVWCIAFALGVVWLFHDFHPADTQAEQITGPDADALIDEARRRHPSSRVTCPDDLSREWWA